ncbi:hypothetical protein CLIB1423_02S07448 [[Candida] railenensis]|uniref:EamA domain-containing protein n=1 Tax=[Candida] railenensis TaxID=45579 RepID=A0A9P0QM13_9ASCO|nr:hypothetical protein CLIB1423_02S07448 [[Candida] railenensis]
MAISVLTPDGGNLTVTESAAHAAASKKKIVAIVFLFILSLVTFVCQTEFTSAAYKYGFEEPIFLLLVTHGSWWTLWPLQIIIISVWRTIDKYNRDQDLVKQKEHSTTATAGTNGGAARYQRLDSHSQLLEDQQNELPVHASPPPTNYYSYFKRCIVKQLHNVYHTSILIFEANVNGDVRTENLNLLIDQNPRISNSDSVVDCVRSLWDTPSFQYIFIHGFLITLVLTVAGITWYAAMSMTYASDVTAIYNCSAFTAYAFAIPILKEHFSWLKVSSVIIAITGVFIVAYSDDGTSTAPGGQDEPAEYPYRFWGNLIILIGAVMYGYYEVLYKKYLCIGPHIAKAITPRRQMTFANFAMGFLGSFTVLVIGTSALVCEITGAHRFNLFNYGDKTGTIWKYIIGSIVSNLLFSGSFLSLMALTSPVLSSVSSLLTIFLIGIVEWVLFGTTLSFQQLLGDFFVIVGFVILTVASWNEISEGHDNDDVEAVSTYSMAMSFDE